MRVEEKMKIEDELKSVLYNGFDLIMRRIVNIQTQQGFLKGGNIY